MNPQLAPAALPIIRVILACLSFWLAAVNIEQVEFLWANETTATRNFYTAIHIAWMFNSVFILGLGLLGPIGPILNFIFTLLSCDTSIHGAGLDIWIYETMALYCMFLPLTGRFSLDRYFSIFKPKEPFGIWPLFLLGLNWGFIFLSGGLAKLTDPLWVSGEAVYYFLSLPHISDPLAGKLASIGFPNMFLNYFVIVFELLFIFLFLFNRTRIVATMIAIGFFAFLGFPMKMLFVAPMGVSLGIFLLLTTREFNWLIENPSRLLPMPKYSKNFVCCAIAFMAFNLVMHLTFRYESMIYPSVNGNLKLQKWNSSKVLEKNDPWSSPIMKSSIIENFFRLYFKYIQPVNRSTFKVEYVSPFNSYHIFGFYVYRVYACNETCEEPIDVFKEDKHPGRYAGTGYTGWIYSLGYRISSHAYLNKLGKFKEINKKNQQYYLSLFNFVAHKLDKNLGEFSHFKLQVVPINLADRNTNSPHPYLQQNYGDFIVFHPVTSQWELLDDYPDFDSTVDLGKHGRLFINTNKEL